MAETKQQFPPDAVTGTTDPEQQVETESKPLKEKLLESIEKMGKLLETQPSMADDILGAITTIRAKTEEIPETERGAITVALGELQQRALRTEVVPEKAKETENPTVKEFLEKIDQIEKDLAAPDLTLERAKEINDANTNLVLDISTPGKILTPEEKQKIDARMDAIGILLDAAFVKARTASPKGGGAKISRTEAELLSEGVSAALAPESPAEEIGSSTAAPEAGSVQPSSTPSVDAATKIGTNPFDSFATFGFDDEEQRKDQLKAALSKDALFLSDNIVAWDISPKTDEQQYNYLAQRREALRAQAQKAVDEGVIMPGTDAYKSIFDIGRPEPVERQAATPPESKEQSLLRTLDEQIAALETQLSSVNPPNLDKVKTLNELILSDNYIKLIPFDDLLPYKDRIDALERELGNHHFETRVDQFEYFVQMGNPPTENQIAFLEGLISSTQRIAPDQRKNWMDRLAALRAPKPAPAPSPTAAAPAAAQTTGPEIGVVNPEIEAKKLKINAEIAALEARLDAGEPVTKEEVRQIRAQFEYSPNIPNTIVDKWIERIALLSLYVATQRPTQPPAPDAGGTGPETKTQQLARIENEIVALEARAATGDQPTTIELNRVRTLFFSDTSLPESTVNGWVTRLRALLPQPGSTAAKSRPTRPTPPPGPDTRGTGPDSGGTSPDTRQAIDRFNTIITEFEKRMKTNRPPTWEELISVRDEIIFHPTLPRDEAVSLNERIRSMRERYEDQSETMDKALDNLESRIYHPINPADRPTIEEIDATISTFPTIPFLPSYDMERFMERLADLRNAVSGENIDNGKTLVPGSKGLDERWKDFRKSVDPAWKKFAEAGEKFVSKHIRGEIIHDKEWKDKTRGEAGLDFLKSGTLITLESIASILGLKAMADVPLYGLQKIYTRREHERLSNAFAELSLETTRHTNETEARADLAVRQKQAELKASIDASPYLKLEQKTALLADLEKVALGYETTKKNAEKKRAKEAAAVLDTYIQTRIKTATALQSTLDGLLVVSGAFAVRVGMNSLFALQRRVEKVDKQMIEEAIKKGEKIEDINGADRLHRIFVGAFTETVAEFAFIKSKKNRGTVAERGVKAVGAFGIISRAVGITSMALDGGTGELSQSFDRILEAAEKMKSLSFADMDFGRHVAESQDRALLTAEKIGSGIRSIFDWAFGGDTSPTPAAVPEIPAGDTSLPTPAPESKSTPPGVESGSTGSEKSDSTGSDTDSSPTPAPESEGTPKPAPDTGTDGSSEKDAKVIEEGEKIETEKDKAPEEKHPDAKPKTGEIPVETKTPEVLRQESIVRGMVGDGHKGEQSGIVEIAMKQLQHDAEKFGYEGNEAGKEAWAKTKAIEMAEAQGFIRPDGDTRLGTAAIGRISEVVERSPDGKLHIVFVDTQAPGTTIEPEKLIGEKTTLFYHETDTTPSPKEEERIAIKEKGTEDRTTETKTTSPLASEGGTKLSPEVSVTYESLDAYKAVKQEGITLLGGRVKFVYEKGDFPIDIDGTIALGKDDITSAEKLLKTDWNRDLPKLFSWSGEAESIAQTHETNVKEAAQEIYTHLSLLQELEKQGLGETPEATFLRREILTEIKKQESVSGGAGSIFNRNDTRIASLFKKRPTLPFGV